eukprot:jgi/Bigna1/82325/fgenesh1_pg.91_\
MAASNPYLDAVNEHGKRMKSILAPLKGLLKDIVNISLRLRKIKGIKSLRNHNGNNNSNDSNPELILIFAHWQNVTDTLEIIRNWAADCETKLVDKGPAAHRERREAWLAFLERKQHQHPSAAVFDSRELRGGETTIESHQRKNTQSSSGMKKKSEGGYHNNGMQRQDRKARRKLCRHAMKKKNNDRSRFSIDMGTISSNNNDNGEADEEEEEDHDSKMLQALAEMSETIHSQSRMSQYNDYSRSCGSELEKPNVGLFKPKVVSIAGEDVYYAKIQNILCVIDDDEANTIIYQSFDTTATTTAAAAVAATAIDDVTIHKILVVPDIEHTFEFEVNIRTDSIDIIGKEFAEDFAEEMQQDPAVVARTLERALNEAFRKRPPDPLSPLSERGSHELCITSLAEVDRLMNDDDKNTINKTKKDIENPRDWEGADDDNDLQEDDTKKKKQKVLLGDNKTATTPRSGKQQGGNDERLKLPPLSREEAYRFGEIEPSVGYIAEARQNEWEELQRKWWTNNKKCCPHVLLVVGARGVGKSEYASFVAGTLTHLIPRFEPEFQVRFKYSSALGSMSKYTEALLGSGSRNAADWRKDVKRKLKEDPTSIIKTLLLPTPTVNVPISLETERYQALSFKRSSEIEERRVVVSFSVELE